MCLAHYRNIVVQKVIDVLDFFLITEVGFVSSVLLVFFRHFILRNISLMLDLAFPWSSRGADEEDHLFTEEQGDF